MIDEEIRRWLTTTPSSDSEYPFIDKGDSHRAKRRRFNRLTPPQSMDSPSDQGSSAGRRPSHDETPQAKRTRSDLAGSSHSLSSLASMSPSSASARSGARSGRISPLKQMKRLRDERHGLEMRPLGRLDGTAPVSLETFLDDVGEFADGRGIVAPAAQDALIDAAALDKAFAWARKRSDHMAQDGDMQVRTPSPGEVLEVVEAATECSSRNYSEATWNVEVHHLVLRMALRPERNHSMFKKLVNFTTATTATIIPDYGSATVSKRIDMCIYIDPQNDRPLSRTYQTAVENLRETLPYGIINFTDFDALHNRFVALSLETKKPGEDGEAGKLQLGVWEMARWNFLRRLADGGGGPRLLLPQFLPSILIDGNEWYLLVTTAEGDKTVLWHRRLIGSTSETKGVYQIVRTLQYIAQWARDVHWPYLRSLVESHGRDDV